MNAYDSAGPRPWDLHFEDSGGCRFILAADVYRCCSAHSRAEDSEIPWDGEKAWHVASSSINNYT